MDVFRQTLFRIEWYIEANRLQPGDRLPSDRELAASLNVSRPVVRQALKVLEALGRVTAQQGSGTYVQDAGHGVAARELRRGLAIDGDLLAQVLPARLAVELEVLRAAFAVRTPELLAQLEAALAEREGQLAEDPEEANLDVRFEAALGQACGNEVLRRLQALIHDVWLEAQIASGAVPGDRFVLHKEHQEIFERFRDGDLEGALEHFRQHLTSLLGGNRRKREHSDERADALMSRIRSPTTSAPRGAGPHTRAPGSRP